MNSNTILNQVTDCSLPVLTSHISLRIGISHLSISGIVAHGRCYISHCFYVSVIFYFSVIFYDCLLVDFCFLSLFSCLLTVVWATENPFLSFYFFSDWSLNFVIIIMVELNYIIAYYITKLHYSRLSYLMMSLLFI